MAQRLSLRAARLLSIRLLPKPHHLRPGPMKCLNHRSILLSCCQHIRLAHNQARSKRPSGLEEPPYTPFSRVEKDELDKMFLVTIGPGIRLLSNINFSPNMSTPFARERRQRFRRFFELSYLEQRSNFFRRAAGDSSAQSVETSFEIQKADVVNIKRVIRSLDGARPPFGMQNSKIPAARYQPAPTLRVSLEEMDEWKALLRRYKDLLKAQEAEVPPELKTASSPFVVGSFKLGPLLLMRIFPMLLIPLVVVVAVATTIVYALISLFGVPAMNDRREETTRPSATWRKRQQQSKRELDEELHEEKSEWKNE